MNRKLFSALALLLALASSAQASVRWTDSSGKVLGVLSDAKCSTGLTCTIVNKKLQIVSSPSITGPLSVTGSITGDGTGSVSGFIQKVTTATATTLTAAQCGGTFINSGAVAVQLPAATGVIGCKYTFITANASNFDIRAGASDLILVLAATTNHAIRNATLGNSVTIQAISTTQWAPVGKEEGTWSDLP